MPPNPDGESTLSADMRAMTQSVASLTQAIASQTQAIGALVQAIGAAHLDHEARLRTLESIVITLKERSSMWQLAQAGYTTIAAAIAAAIAFLRQS